MRNGILNEKRGAYGRSAFYKISISSRHDTQLPCSYAIMQTEIRKPVYPMKMKRLIGILSILLQRETVTAPELVEPEERREQLGALTKVLADRYRRD